MDNWAAARMVWTIAASISFLEACTLQLNLLTKNMNERTLGILGSNS